MIHKQEKIYVAILNKYFEFDFIFQNSIIKNKSRA